MNPADAGTWAFTAAGLAWLGRIWFTFLREKIDGRHRQASAAVQGDPGDGAGASCPYYPGGCSRFSVSVCACATKSAGRAGAGVAVAKTKGVAGPPPVFPCLICTRPGAGASGMCAACEAQLVPRGTLVNLAGMAAMQTALQARVGTYTVAAAPTPLPKDDARRVDLIGWRIWRVTSLGYLRAITADSIYMPGEAMVAHKDVGDQTDSGSGVHVFKDMAAAAREIDAYVAHGGGAYALGTVQLWGEVVEHERGYRAERAMIRSIDGVVLPKTLPWDSEPAKALAFLRERYGVGAHVPVPVVDATGEPQDG